MTNGLQIKIQHSIDLIRKGEKLALLMSDKGYYVGFSGGKDSQVLLDLVKRAGVKYEAVYNATTNDPADNVRFVKQYYPDVRIDCPTESFLTLVGKYGLPTMDVRYCCRILKESKGAGRVTLTGVRADESQKRAEYSEFEKKSRNKKNRKVNLEQMEQMQFKCVKGKDQFMLYPILHWTSRDVWNYIEKNNLSKIHVITIASASAAFSVPLRR